MNPTRRTALATLAVTALALPLAACSKKEETATSARPAAPLPAAQAFDAVAAKGQGFTVGAMMSTNTVYVLFDPQCPHCGHLWEAALPLHTKAKFVWMPVSFINAKSTPQGAALLAAANPLEAMSAHEKSVLAGTGGMAASASVPPQAEAAIKANTELLNSLGVESVPFIVARHAQSGQPVSKTGAMTTPALAEFLGIPAP